MKDSEGPIIDMTPDGAFVDPPKATLGTIVLRVLVFGIILFVGAVAFWTALFMLPVLILMGLAAYLVMRSQMRR